jgi:hypothetical protein
VGDDLKCSTRVTSNSKKYCPYCKKPSCRQCIYIVTGRNTVNHHKILWWLIILTIDYLLIEDWLLIVWDWLLIDDSWILIGYWKYNSNLPEFGENE